MGVQIRPARSEDISGVRSLALRWAADGETIGLEAPSSEVLRDRVGRCFFVAVEDRTVVGFVLGDAKSNEGTMSAVMERGARYLELEELYIHPEHRSAGIGAQLVESVVDWARRSGVRYVSAYSATRDVDRVLSFYRSQGFDSWSVQVVRDLDQCGPT